MIRFSLVVCSTLVLAGCGSSSSDSGTGGSSSADAGGAGGNATIAGSVAGKSFDAASSSLWIGAPDSDSTTVVYVFSTAVGCTEIQKPGWDTKIADATQVVEMKAFGTDPATFEVVKTPVPAAGQASVNYTLSSTSTTPTELSASGGTMTLTTVAVGKSVSGSFSLDFDADKLTGTFEAAFCPGAHEP